MSFAKKHCEISPHSVAHWNNKVLNGETWKYYDISISYEREVSKKEKESLVKKFCRHFTPVT